ncbi:MAG: TIGR03617 family F420-dependent LLM class oxidoreductase [Steroidobacteraceae bacterium]
MKVIQRLQDNLRDVVPDYKRKRALGYQRFSGVENKTNPLFPVLMCAAHDPTAEFSTSIAVAFAKSPMVLALEAYSVNQFCEGRFSLGIGSQIKPHIVRRFGMPWSDKPATQMREYIAALNAIWTSFESGGPLNFQGETYRHTLITPEFIPFKEGYGKPRLLVGAVGPGMTKVAAELADGLITHSFVSEKSLRAISLKTILETLERTGRSRAEFELVLPLFITTGSNEEEFKRNREHHRNRIGFYASTPAYKVQLDLLGWSDLHEETRRLTREGRWDELGDPITDEMVNTFTVMGEPHEIAPRIKQRFGDFVDTIRCELELEDQEMQYEIVKAIEAA